MPRQKKTSAIDLLNRKVDTYPIVKQDVATQLKIQLEIGCDNVTLNAVKKFQVESFRSEGIRKDGAQIRDLYLEILDPDKVDVQVRIELAHELTTGATRAAEVPLQLGRDGDGGKLDETLRDGFNASSPLRTDGQAVRGILNVTTRDRLPR